MGAISNLVCGSTLPSSTARKSLSTIMSKLDRDVELRGITDVTDTDYNHITQIHSLIALLRTSLRTYGFQIPSRCVAC